MGKKWIVDFWKFTYPPIPIEGGAGLFLYEYHSFTHFLKQQFIFPAQDLDVVQIWLKTSLFGDVLPLQRGYWQFLQRVL